MRLTHRLADGRYIEVSADRGGPTLRLRVRLCEGDFVVVARRHDYRFSADTVQDVIDDFTAEFEAIAGIAAPRPLFPNDLFSLRCPAAPQHWPEPIVWGIAAGTVEQPKVVTIPPEPLTPELVAEALPVTPREVFRIAATCIKGGCRHWREGGDGAEQDGCCSLVERVIARYPNIVGHGLQPCGIRAVCRWFHQEGPPACRACPGVVTDIGELPQDEASETVVGFY